MPHIIKDRVCESATTTGTGAFTLAGALTGFRAFSAVCAVNDTVPYLIWGVDASGNATGEWEVGVGTYSAASTLTRTTVEDSSNAGAAVTFSAGTKYVALSVNADELKNMPTTVLASDLANSTTTLANVTGMSFSAEANATYEVEFTGVYQTAATTTGIALALDIPSGSVYGMGVVMTSVTAVAGFNQIADAATTGASTGVTTAATNTPMFAKWIVAVGATGGTVQLMMKSEVASSAATLKAGLCLLKARRVK